MKLNERNVARALRGCNRDFDGPTPVCLCRVGPGDPWTLEILPRGPYTAGPFGEVNVYGDSSPIFNASAAARHLLAAIPAKALWGHLEFRG